MIKKEITEIRKRFTKEACSLTRICGCYVNNEKEKVTTFAEPFLALPEEEMFKYFELFRKSMSGTLGKNLMNLEFPLDTEFEGGTQDFLLRLRNSGLKDEALLDEFYDKVIQNLSYVGSYLILLVHDAYDIPGKTSDGLTMDDASDEVYQYILCAVCPVNLSKPGLIYNSERNLFTNCLREWMVDAPDLGFLFPAFNDRSADIHSLLYYTKDAKNLHDSFTDSIFGCVTPLPAASQKEAFASLVAESLGEECEYEIVRNIHENLHEMLTEHADDPQPLALNEHDVRDLFERSGVSDEQLEGFEKVYEACAGESATLLASNVANVRKFELKTPDIVISVNPDRADLIETRVIDGIPYLMIPANDNVEVNGIVTRAIHE
jgi:hypothetical protein